MNKRDAELRMRENLDLLGSEHGDHQTAMRWFVAQGSDAVPVLLEALRTESRSSLRRARIVATLGEIRDEAAVPALRTLFDEVDLGWETAQALGKIGTIEAERVLIDGLRDPRLAIVKECTKALARFSSPDAGEALGRQLAHADPSVRYYAVKSLMQAQPRGHEPLLRAHLGSEEDPEVRRLIETGLP